MELTAIVKAARAHGLTATQQVESDGDGWVEIEAVFTVSPEGRGKVGMLYWTGSYPFANDHDFGILPLSEALSFIVWFFKSEQRKAENEVDF